jgi:deazaflavin-dependent oxidoreductase (nitroreductase family)
MALTDHKPTGLMRTLLRAPIWLYRLRLGWLTDHRFVYIAHRGRRSGERRETVVEVVRYFPAIPAVVVNAAWGAHPDWYLNLKAAPALEIRLATQRWEHPRQRFLSSSEAERILQEYQQMHPYAWEGLAPLLGFPADPADPRWPEVAARVKAIAFAPAS